MPLYHMQPYLHIVSLNATTTSFGTYQDRTSRYRLLRGELIWPNLSCQAKVIGVIGSRVARGRAAPDRVVGKRAGRTLFKPRQRRHLDVCANGRTSLESHRSDRRRRLGVRPRSCRLSMSAICSRFGGVGRHYGIPRRQLLLPHSKALRAGSNLDSS